MTYRTIAKERRKHIEKRLNTLFKDYGMDAETVANYMINRRRTERRNRKKIRILQQEIDELRV